MTTKIPVELSSTPSIVDNGGSGSLTIDVAQNIILDHDSGHSLVLQGSSTSYGSFFLNNSTNLAIATGISNGEIEFFANGSERMRILSGGGLTFNGDTAAANALNDYEEGIHTVTMTDSGGGATITLNTSFNQISYTKIGRLVHVSGVLLPSAVSGSFTGTTNISLPFAGANLSDQAGKGFINVETYSVDFTAGTAPAGHIGEGIAAASILVSADNAAYGFARVNTSSQIYVGGTYITDA